MQTSVKEYLPECEEMIKFGLSFINDPHIISVGSGSGSFEKHLISELNKNIVCVDPLPYNYERSSDFLKPDYDTILDIEEPKKFNSLLLVWPSPTDYGPDKYIKYDSKYPYDYDALLRIEPDFIFTVYGPCGASGSKQYLNAIFSDANYFRNSTPKIDFSRLEFSMPNKTYKCVSSIKVVYGKGYGFDGKTIVYACFVNKDLIDESTTYNFKHVTYNKQSVDLCNIM